jgi:glyoxylase-like metal-dependent hydrolase (beta-lactamase superfamily II)
MHKALAVCAAMILMAAAVAEAEIKTIDIGKPARQSAVPKWDVRGTGTLAWQGIACADMTGNGRFVALGTIAPPGDPHVFLLDAAGKVVGQHRAGERWIGTVAVGDGGSPLAAFCTTPEGKAGDRPVVKLLSADEAGKILDSDLAEAAGAGDRFVYGDHSNHYAARFAAWGDRMVLVSAGKLGLFAKTGGRPATVPFVRGGSAYGLAALAVSPAGRAAVGLAVRQADRDAGAPTLAVVDLTGPALAWTRPAVDDVAAPPAWKEGTYGPSAGPFTDKPAWAALAVAVDAAGGHFASADYQGWNRRFESKDADFGLHFMPAPPTIHVYDSTGKPVRRWGPETFQAPLWCDLAFTPDGRRILAFPHNWACRGLAGQAFLPADDDARTLYSLDVETGDATAARFPDAISSVAVGGDGEIAVGCWNRRVYLLDPGLRPAPALPDGIDVGAPGLVRMTRDGSRVLVAGADGVARMIDRAGKELWRTDLAKAAQPGDKPWTRGQKLGAVGPGVWRKSGARTHGDMGGQYIIEAPEGLILIDPNVGLSIEQTLAQMRASGLDPLKVRYLVLTHEHGDHAPGSYLWRLLTGCQVIATPETAFILRHHTQVCGYGFHPPQPVDILIPKDQEMTLAGLAVRFLRLPGHTYGGLGMAFEKDGRRHVATGDLIMPGGRLGYSGAADFSAADVLASLRKLDALKPDEVLGGHGGGEPGDFIAKGIAAGAAAGWSRMKPEKPDPFFGLTQRNYLVVAWLERIVTAAFGDVDGDGLPDVAVLCRTDTGPAVKVYLNRKGRFEDAPDLVLPVPETVVDMSSKVRLVRTGTAKAADIFVSGDRGAVLLAAEDGKRERRTVEFPGLVRAMQVIAGDFSGSGRTDLLFGQRFGGQLSLAAQAADGSFRLSRDRIQAASFFDLGLVDVDGDGRADLVTSGGEVFLRQAGGRLATTPALRLKVREDDKTWTFMAAGDFNKDGRPDLVFLASATTDEKRKEKRSVRILAFYNTGDAARPYKEKADAAFTVDDAEVMRDGPTAGDWNGDGIADIATVSSQGAVILLGSPQGLGPQRVVRIKLDYSPHFDTRLGLADFSADGRLDLAGWGPSPVQAVGVYIWVQP